MAHRGMIPRISIEDITSTRWVPWIERIIMVLVVAILSLTLPASHPAAPAASPTAPTRQPGDIATPTREPLDGLARATAQPAPAPQTLGVAAALEPDFGSQGVPAISTELPVATAF